MSERVSEQVPGESLGLGTTSEAKASIIRNSIMLCLELRGLLVTMGVGGGEAVGFKSLSCLSLPCNGKFGVRLSHLGRPWVYQPLVHRNY